MPEQRDELLRMTIDLLGQAQNTGDVQFADRIILLLEDGRAAHRYPESGVTYWTVLGMARQISPRHPQRLSFVQHYSAGMGLSAELHGELAALDEAGEVLTAEIRGRADDDPIRLYVLHARVLIARSRQRSAPGEAATRELIEAGLARLGTMQTGGERLSI